jgi:hypothetical protein
MAEKRQHGVTFWKESEAYGGFTLIPPAGTNDVWIIDMRGQFVHRWNMPCLVGEYANMLSNGNLFYQGMRPLEKSPLPDFGGVGGHLLEVDWDCRLVAKYDDPYHTHDAQRMDNGNFMIVRYEQVPQEIAQEIKGGIPNTERDGEIWANTLYEVDPGTGKIEWEWKAHEHLDPREDAICHLEHRSEWTHCNTVKILPDGNILTCFRNINEIAIIDKTTGEITWKWGSGEVYHPHDPTLLDSGNILLLDNGAHRNNDGPSYSRVIEINPNTGKIEWEYKADPAYKFYTGVAGGCQRLPNGNTFITESCLGRLFEINMSGDLVWEYVNPFYALFQDQLQNFVYRAFRYGSDYGGFNERELNPGKYKIVNELYSNDASRLH